MTNEPFALFGGTPKFSTALPVGQLYFPEWERYEASMRGIFDRHYYTNHGPLAQEFEENLAAFFDVKHVICVTNATIGLMMAAEALGLKGSVIMPSFTFIASAQSLKWCGLTPVFCDVDPETHQLSPEGVEALIDDDVSAILAVNLWGGACDVKSLKQISDNKNIELYFDSAHSFGCQIDGMPIGNFGRAEVFSFHATKVLSATEGGCVTTNDDEVAARLRNIRSSYGAGKKVDVIRTTNGRMSEAQAAIGLLSLEDYPKIASHNKELFDAYEVALKGIRGIALVKPTNVTTSNYQYAVCEVNEDLFGLSRDDLQMLLQAENVLARRYFYPATHRCIGFTGSHAALPVTEELCMRCLQLPLGAKVGIEDVAVIGNLINRAQAQATTLKRRLNEDR